MSFLVLGSSSLMIEIVLAATLLCSVYTDVSFGRIYNWTTIPVMAGGLVFGLTDNGLAGLLFAFSGLLAGGGVMLVPFVLRVVGGGDVKLLAALGALCGPWFALKCFCYASLMAGTWALLSMAIQGKLFSGLAWTGRFFLALFIYGQDADNSQRLNLQAIPFAVCVFGGVLMIRCCDVLSWFLFN